MKKPLPYFPTPDEIRAECARIQATWSAAEEVSRRTLCRPHKSSDRMERNWCVVDNETLREFVRE